MPTYTSVTGASLIGTQTLSDGTLVYRYHFDSADTLIKYYQALSEEYGWSPFTGDDESTYNIVESSLIKGNKFVVVCLMINLNEVWITCVTKKNS